MIAPRFKYRKDLAIRFVAFRNLVMFDILNLLAISGVLAQG